MRALIQRVSEASVTIDGVVTGAIGPGLCVFLGIKHSDYPADASRLAERILKLRVFSDVSGRMNRSLLDVAGSILIVSQFTLYANLSRGNRPSYSEAAVPELANDLYEAFVASCRQRCSQVATGVFRAHMQVHITNDGPVTIWCDSER